MNVLIKFYDEQVKINIPEKYEIFQAKICEVLQLPESNFNELVIFYLDSDNDKILVTNKVDFEEMIKQLKRNEIKEIQVEVVEGSKIQFPSQNIVEAHIQLSDIQAPKQEQQQLQVINPNQVKEIDDNKNNQMFDINSNVIHNEVIFDIDCSICHITPIKNIIYLCEQCNMYLCSDCEGKHGPSHRHPFLKIRNPALIEGNKPPKRVIVPQKVVVAQEEKKEESIFDSIKKFPDAIKNWFKDEENEPDYLIRLARANYDLANVTDEELLKAIHQSKGNIDEAIILLLK